MSDCPHCNGTGIDPAPAHWPEGFREQRQHDADVAAARDRLRNQPDVAQYLGARFAHFGYPNCEHKVSVSFACKPCDLALVEHGTPRRCEVRT